MFLPEIFPKVAAKIANRKWENELKYRFRPNCQRQQRTSTETLLIFGTGKKNVFPNTPAVVVTKVSSQNTSRRKSQWKPFPYKWFYHTSITLAETLFLLLYFISIPLK
jgi:hypothetical protein